MFQRKYWHLVKQPNFVQENGNWGHLLIFRDDKVRQIVMDFLGEYHHRKHREMSIIVFCNLDIITELLKRRID